MQQVIILTLAFACTGMAQPQNPMSADARADYQTIKDYAIRAAEKMSAEDYGFKPTPEIRSFGQLMGHMADDQYNFCSAVMGENKSHSFEKNTPPKAEMATALKTAFGYCDSAYNAMVDSWSQQSVKILGRDRPRLAAIMFNTQHAWEHYGNAVVYLRLRSVVPPSSERKQ